MFLFNKKTKNVIKYTWAVVSIIIILSMVITYSGFTMLATTQPTAPIDIPPEALQMLEEAKARGTSTLPAPTGDSESVTPELRKAIEEALARDLGTSSTTSTPVTPVTQEAPAAATPTPEIPVPQLNFSL